MITCVANDCRSTQNTRIDGKQIVFFPFPEDSLRKNQWLSSCNLAPSGKESLQLCELHFEKVYFTANKDLKSNAVPTLFGRTEESLKKQKAENTSQITPVKVPLKRKKLDEHSHALVTPPQSPSVQDNIEDMLGENKTDTLMNHSAMNGSALSTSATQNSQTKVQKSTYRLIIQIDKIRGKPGPKCKKILPLKKFNDDTKDIGANESGSPRKLRPLRVRQFCANGSCQLKKCIYQSKLAFQCEVCGKYYIANREETNNYCCSKCFKTFPDLQSLSVHIRRHFMCDICLTECSSQMMYDKHIRLHVSTDPQYPYKCHQCRKIFDLKDSVKQHCLQEHVKMNMRNTTVQLTSPITAIVSQADCFCVNCNISFPNDQAYRNHISSHGKKEGITCNITSETKNIIPVPNPLTGSQIGILQAVKFSCRVCSKEFDNVKEVDLHTRTHLKERPEVTGSA